MLSFRRRNTFDGCIDKNKVIRLERPNLGGLVKGQATRDGRTDRPKHYTDDAFVIKLNSGISRTVAAKTLPLWTIRPLLCK